MDYGSFHHGIFGKEGYNLGFSIIYTSHLRANLPENIGTIAMLKNSEDGLLLIDEPKWIWIIPSWNIWKRKGII